MARPRMLRRARAALLAAGLALSAPAPWQHGGSDARADSVLDRVGTSAWLARLSTGDAAARRGAIDALGRFAAPPEPRVTTALLGVFNDAEGDPSVLIAAAGALATARHPGSPCALLNLAWRASYLPGDVQAALLRALSRQDDAVLARCPNPGGGARMGPSGPSLRGLAALRVAPGGPREAVDAAARALADQPDVSFSQLVQLARRTSGGTALALRAAALRGDPRWGGFVLEQLRATSPTAVAAAIEAAGTLRLTEAVPELTELARDAADRGLRRAALVTLGALGDPGDPALLRESLRAPLFRRAALDAVDALGDRAFVPDVAALLSNSGWPPDRADAAEVLGSLGGGDARAALRAALQSEREPTVRAALLHALAREGSADSLRVLAVEAAREPAARWALVEASLRSGERARAPAGLAAAASRGEPAALALTALAGGHDEALRAALNAPSADARAAAALGLAWGPVSSLEPALAARLSREDDEGVRVALALALGRSGGDAARGVLADLLARETDAPSLAALAAAQAAGDHGWREALPALEAFARARHPVLRGLAARALGQLGGAGARGVLESLVRFDVDPEVRGVAAWALALAAGDDALDAIGAADAVAWTARLRDLLARARAVASGASDGAPVQGPSVVRVSGATPRSVWALTQPDGGLALAVASGDGELFVPGAPSATAPLRRLEGL